MSETLPILYSFRRCPYAIRARFSLYYAGIKCELREVDLKNKPAEMLKISSKGTVPVLQLPEGQVLEQSLEIMYWAISQNDPQNWHLNKASLPETIDKFIKINDTNFKDALDKYKYTTRYPGEDRAINQEKCLEFLHILQYRLEEHAYLFANKISIADIAVFPFIRQCRLTDEKWFDAQPLPAVHHWLANFLTSRTFTNIMAKYEPWSPDDEPIIFGADKEKAA